MEDETKTSVFGPLLKDQMSYLDEKGVVHPPSLEAVHVVQEVLVAQVEARRGNCCILQVPAVDNCHNDRRKRCCYCLNRNPSSPGIQAKEPVEAAKALWPFSLSELQPERRA